MPWARKGDEWPMDPRVAAVGNEAWGAHDRALGWCSVHSPSGFVPSAIWAIFCAPRVKQVTAKLVEQRFIEPVTGGWQILEIGRFLESAEQAQKRREKTAERVKNWRQKHPKNAASDAGRNDERNAGSNGVTHAGTNDAETKPPIPIPNPNPPPSADSNDDDDGGREVQGLEEYPLSELEQDFVSRTGGHPGAPGRTKELLERLQVLATARRSDLRGYAQHFLLRFRVLLTEEGCKAVPTAGLLLDDKADGAMFNRVVAFADGDRSALRKGRGRQGSPGAHNGAAGEGQLRPNPGARGVPGEQVIR